MSVDYRSMLVGMSDVLKSIDQKMGDLVDLKTAELSSRASTPPVAPQDETSDFIGLLIPRVASALSREATQRGFRLGSARESLARAAGDVVLRAVVDRLREEAVGTQDWQDAYEQVANDLEAEADLLRKAQ